DRQMRQARTDEDEREPLLGQFVAGRAQRGYVLRTDILHLVDEQRDSAAGSGRKPGNIDQELNQVDLDVAGIGPAENRRDIDTRLPRPRQSAVRPGPGGRPLVPGTARAVALRERLEHAQDMPALRGGDAAQLTDRDVQSGRERPPQRLVGPRLELAAAPAPTDGSAAGGVEQDGLADAAQAG